MKKTKKKKPYSWLTWTEEDKKRYEKLLKETQELEKYPTEVEILY